MKILAATLYGSGVLCVTFLLGATIARAEYVPFPDAMLPMKLHELAEIWLTIGFLPMFAATLLFRKTWASSSRAIFIPVAICAGAAIWIVYAVLCNG